MRISFLIMINFTKQLDVNKNIIKEYRYDKFKRNDENYGLEW